MPEATPAFKSFVGVDLHKSTVTLVSVGTVGTELQSLSCHTKCVGRIEELIRAQNQPCHLAVEAIGFVPIAIGIHRQLPRVRRTYGHCRRHRAQPTPWQAAEERSQRRSGCRGAPGPRQLSPRLDRR